MILLNLGCGGTRPHDEWWINIDNLHAIFPDSEVPERKQMDNERNYLNADLRNGIPFEDNSVEGILCSHILEHLDCHEAVKLLKECHRVLKPGGILRVVLPDPDKFHNLTVQGATEWGEPNPSSVSFMEYALFFYDHKQLVSQGSLFCMLWLAGFREYFPTNYQESRIDRLAKIDNRPVFSGFYEAVR